MVQRYGRRTEMGKLLARCTCVSSSAIRLLRFSLPLSPSSPATRQQMSVDPGAGGGFIAPSSSDHARDERTLSQRLRLGVSRYAADPVPLELLRKYIAYARKYVHPRVTPAAAAVLQDCYLRMRSEARMGKPGGLGAKGMMGQRTLGHNQTS